MNKINIVQFLPYFPPHKGGLENVAEELSSFYVSQHYGEVINIVFSGGQKYGLKEYNKNSYQVYIIPAFDIIPNFPVPIFWGKDFWRILKIVSLKIKNDRSQKDIIIQTHTRFFLSSLLGGLFAKYHKLKWVHIEHGSDYIILDTKFKTKISLIYDKLIGKWIFQNTTKIIAISEACKIFIQKEFINKKIQVIYRGIVFNKNLSKKKGDIRLLFIGRLVKLKGIDLLLQAYKNIACIYKDIKLYIIGDGEERKHIEEFMKNNSNLHIYLLGYQEKEYIENFLNINNSLIIMPSLQEGLGTVAVEGLISRNVVIASDAGGIKEVSKNKDLIIFQSRNVIDLEKAITHGLDNYFSLQGESQYLVSKKFSWHTNIKKYYIEIQKVFG